MSQADAARRMRISANRLNELIRKKRGVTIWFCLSGSRMKRVVLSDVKRRPRRLRDLPRRVARPEA
jgi:hypothetical protein